MVPLVLLSMFAEAESVTWTELAHRVPGKTVQVTLADASVATGRVERVTSGGVVLREQPQPLPRAAVKSVRYEVVKGSARAKWAIGLAVAGSAAFLFLGAREVWGDGGPSAPVAMGGVFVGSGAAAGYGIGRARDKRTVVLEVVP